jgi:uncharacterized protein
MTTSETRRPATPPAPRRRRNTRPRAATSTEAPSIRSLSSAECYQILARNHVGRMAFSLHDRVDIEPLHYVFDDGWLFGRTAVGKKMTILRHRPWVAFEVDEIDGMFDWRSVVVHGGFHVVTADGPPLEAKAWERAVELVRQLVPATGSPSDPAPFRTVFFRIAIDEVAGRVASST